MKTARWMMLGAMLGFIASSAVSCGGPVSKCGPQNCPFGCCDAAGSCQMGSSDAQCGSQGRACTACSFSQRCSVGVCTAIGAIGGGSAQGGGGGSTGGGSGGGDGGVTGGGGGSTTGGGGGSMTGGGGGSTTGGGGGSTTGGGGGSTGGGGGSTTCSPANCPGCCRDNSCILLPDNFDDTSCGLMGSACIDCAAQNFVCNSTNATCVPPGTGGGGGSTGGGGGSTGGGGGATGGGGGTTMVAGGDTCASAVTLSAPGSYSGTTVGATNDYIFSDVGSCQGGSSSSSTGPDVVYRITVPPNATLDIDLLPEANYDTTLNLLALPSDCSSTPTCLAGSDSDPESIVWVNTTGATVNVLVLIDSYSSGTSGSYTLTYTLTP